MAAYLVALDCFEDAKLHASRALVEAREVKATVLTALHSAAFRGCRNIASPRRIAATDVRETAASCSDTWMRG